jgi:hypothetical protein
MQGLPRWFGLWIGIFTLAAAAVFAETVASAAEPAWQEVAIAEAGLTFSAPGAVEKKTEENRTTYVLQADEGESVFEVSIMPLADPAAFRSKWATALDAMRDGAVTNLKGKLLDEMPVDFAGLTGREVLIKSPAGYLVRLRIHLVDKWLVMIEVVTSDKSTVSPAMISKFFGSLKVVERAAAPAVARTSPTGATHAAFIDGLAARDGKGLYAMMHPELQVLLDPPLFQAFLEIVAEQLGPVVTKSTDDIRFFTEESATSKTVRGTDKVGFKNGTYEVKTTVTDGQLSGFNLAAPQLSKLDQLLYEYLNKLRGTENEKLRAVAEFYANQGSTFIQTLFTKGAKAAYDLLDPRVQAQLPFEKVAPDLERVRTSYAPIGKIELETIRFIADAEMNFEEMDITVSLERIGKKPAMVEFSYKFDGFRAVMIGYSFKQDVDLTAPPAAPAPVAPPVPAAPVPAPPKSSEVKPSIKPPVVD